MRGVASKFRHITISCLIDVNKTKNKVIKQVFLCWINDSLFVDNLSKIFFFVWSIFCLRKEKTLYFSLFVNILINKLYWIILTVIVSLSIHMYSYNTHFLSFWVSLAYTVYRSLPLLSLSLSPSPPLFSLSHLLLHSPSLSLRWPLYHVEAGESVYSSIVVSSRPVGPLSGLDVVTVSPLFSEACEAWWRGDWPLLIYTVKKFWRIFRCMWPMKLMQGSMWRTI